MAANHFRDDDSNSDLRSLTKAVNKMDSDLFGSEFGKKGALKEFDERIDNLERMMELRHEENVTRIEKIEEKIRNAKFLFMGMIASTIASGSGTISLKSLIEFLKHLGI